MTDTLSPGDVAVLDAATVCPIEPSAAEAIAHAERLRALGYLALIAPGRYATTLDGQTVAQRHAHLRPIFGYLNANPCRIGQALVDLRGEDEADRALVAERRHEPTVPWEQIKPSSEPPKEEEP